MGRILEAIRDFLDHDGWEVRPVEGKTALGMNYHGDKGMWHCVAWAREEQSEFVFYSIYPLHAPQDKREAAAEYLTRINYGLFIGNFEMDFDDGEIRYKTSIDVEDDPLTPALIRPVIYVNLLNMDRFLPGLEAVLTGELTPQAASAQYDDTDDA
jgi:hypothetical protein